MKTWGLCLPMVDKLVNPSIIGANMGLGKHPHPISSCINRRCNYALRSRAWSRWRQAKFYGHRLQSTKGCQEKYGTCGVGFSTIKGIDPFKKWKVDIMIIYYKQLIFIYCLQIPKRNIYSDSLVQVLTEHKVPDCIT